MTPERIHVLELMGFDWGPGTSRQWEGRYGELKVYFELHGHCKVPSGTPLERWCRYQRGEYRKWKRGERTSMTKTKYEALESINFDFSPNNTTSFDKDGGITYNYRAAPTMISSSATGIDVSNSTKTIEYKEGQEHEFLSSLDEYVYGSAFLQRLHELQDFKDIHGHCRVPAVYAANKKLG